MQMDLVTWRDAASLSYLNHGEFVVCRDYEDFLQDLEEDPTYREGVNIYKSARIPIVRDDVTTEDEDAPKISLQEMLDDLNLSDGEDAVNVMEADSDVN